LSYGRTLMRFIRIIYNVMETDDEVNPRRQTFQTSAVPQRMGVAEQAGVLFLFHKGAPGSH